ncbi:MAG: hypothetical protein HY701_13420, partial [Gemmatimonadetes bacterium]|nr:hypothetical protein [Gemmatimonadota bacterium]
MSSEAALRPFGESEPEGGPSQAHLTDYWQVIARRFWLVLLIFAVTTASAVWAISRQRTYYQARIALQVNDPMQRTRSIAPRQTFSGMDVFTDPIQSEIQLLHAAPVANRVAEQLGLRLMPASPDVPRSSLMRDVYVAAEAPEGSYRLVYDAAGRLAELWGPDGMVLGRAAAGEVLETDVFRFTVQPAPDEVREHALTVSSLEGASGIVRGQLAATPRQNTNIIDATYTSSDPVLAPLILNATAEALRAYGAERMRVSSSAEARFIEDQLVQSREQLQRSLQQIQDFKRTGAFTNLSAEEQALLDRNQELRTRIEQFDSERSMFNRVTDEVQSGGISETDFARLSTEIGGSSNPSLGAYLDGVRTL